MRPSIGRSWAVCRCFEQHLDHSDIDVLFQEMGGKAVPECVRRYPLVDPGHVGSRMAGAMELARGERTDGVLTGKQPPSWPTRLAPSPQQLEQMRRQHDVSVFATLEIGRASCRERV